MNKYLRTCTKSLYVWDGLEAAFEFNAIKLLEQAEAMQVYHNTLVDSAVKDAYSFPLGFFKSHEEPNASGRHMGLAVNCTPDLASDVGNALALKVGTFGATWHVQKDLKVKVSLRSTGSFDVATLAQAYGGGGHKNSAGFYCTLQDLADGLL